MYKPPGPVFIPGMMIDNSKLATQLTPEPQSGLVKTWSYSTLKKFESCPHAVYLTKVQKIPVEQGEAAARGERIHTEGELYIKGELGDFPDSFGRYRAQLERLREGYTNGMVNAEDEWGFDVEYNPVGWKDPTIWLRMKLDCLEFLGDTNARVIDFKTGRKFGNEMSHGQQLQLYAVSAFTREPQLEFVETEAWYLDQNEPPLVQTYTRKEALSFRPRWTTRALALTTATQFSPRPSRSNCRYCDGRKTGTCEWAVEN